MKKIKITNKWKDILSKNDWRTYSSKLNYGMMILESWEIKCNQTGDYRTLSPEQISEAIVDYIENKYFFKLKKINE